MHFSHWSRLTIIFLSGCILVQNFYIQGSFLILFTPLSICQKGRSTWTSLNSKELKNVNQHKKYCTFQKSLSKLIGLAVIPNMEIYMKWTNHLLVAALKVGAGDWLIRTESISEGSKSAWAAAETHGGGTVPLRAALFRDWSWELSPLLIATGAFHEYSFWRVQTPPN